MPLFHVFKLLKIFTVILKFNPAALRKAKIIYNFGLSDSNRFKHEINSQSTKVDEIANSTDPDESVIMSCSNLIYTIHLLLIEFSV